MLKKIFKGFLYLLIPLSLVGLYFYIFPVYSDFWISEERFYTRFHSEWFDSPQNGFHTWESIIEWLEEYDELVREFDVYHRCFIWGDCSVIAPNMTEIEKQESLTLLLQDTQKLDAFWEIVRNFIAESENLTRQYSFISALNYNPSPDSEIALWPEALYLTYLRSFTRWMLFYLDIIPRSEANSLLISYHRFLSWLSIHLDDSLVSYLSLIEILETLYNYFEVQLPMLSPAFQRLHLRVFEEHDVAKDMIENGIKVEYNYQRLLFDALEDWNISSNNTWWFNPIPFFFYNHADSINILQKIFSEALEGDCEFEISLNGRNYIGRLLFDFSNCHLFSSQFRKQAELLNQRQAIIDLLSD